jgi:outer membrane protein TolC
MVLNKATSSAMLVWSAGSNRNTGAALAVAAPSDRDRTSWGPVLTTVLLALVAVAASISTAAAQGRPAFSSPSSEERPYSTEQQGGPQAVNPTGSVTASQNQNPFLGSTPSGEATDTVLAITIADAIDRGLKYNLGLIQSNQGTRSTQAQRLHTLANLLPDISLRTSETVQQIDLATVGIKFPGFPNVVGPFSFSDVRAYLSQNVFDWSAIRNVQSASQNLKASQLSYKSARDLVVLAVGNAYLIAIADAATIEAQQAQLHTAQSLYQRAVDQKKAGVVAGIDELRANVERQTQQQRLIVSRNQFEKDKLSLARAIGLPPGQQFTLADAIPYAPLNEISLEHALYRAYATRPDYQAAKAQVRAAELAREAAVAERYPTLSTDLNYGAVGTTFSQSHGTVFFSTTLNVPIFASGRARADILQADAVLQQRRAELENLRGQIDYDVRTAILDLRAATDQVQVSKSNVDLASQTLTQGQDRFAAGVADNLEVVQAQESVAEANQAYISSLYAHNLAKIELARAVGIAEEAVREYLGGPHAPGH